MKSSRICKILTAFAVSLSLVLSSVPAFAAEVVFTTLAEMQDLKVMFTFETEIVPITFISPSGEEYDSDDSNVSYSEGDLWATYVIYDAEAGDWSVSYDLGTNSSISYVISANDAEIEIQAFSCSVEDGTIYYDFYVYSTDADITCEYDLYAVNADTGAFYAVTDGTASVLETVSGEVTPTLLSDGTYTFELDVTYSGGIVEEYDTASSEELYFEAAEITASDETAISEDTETGSAEDTEVSETESQESETADTQESASEGDTAEDSSEDAASEEAAEDIQEEASYTVFDWMRENPGIPSFVIGAAVFIFCFFYLRREW